MNGGLDGAIEESPQTAELEVNLLIVSVICSFVRSFIDSMNKLVTWS